MGTMTSLPLRRWIVVAGAGLAIAAAIIAWRQLEGPHYFAGNPDAVAELLDPPSAANSSATRAELDTLLALQSSRTPAQVQSARRDRKKDVERFFGALGLTDAHAADLRGLRRLADRVEDDLRTPVNVAKKRFLRLRPYAIEPRLEPCIRDVREDRSYPSGHAAYGYAMAELLSLMVPERRAELQARAGEFAAQRMMCGVHFPSDLVAGQIAARNVMSSLAAIPSFQADLRGATTELRAALGLAPLPEAGTVPPVSSARSRRSASRLRRNFRHAAHVSCRLSAATPRTCAAARAVRR